MNSQNRKENQQQNQNKNQNQQQNQQNQNNRSQNNCEDRGTSAPIPKGWEQFCSWLVEKLE